MLRTETGYSLAQHQEGASRQLDAPILRLDLARELADLRSSRDGLATGHAAKTLVKSPELQVVLISLNAGASLGEHRTRARVTVQTLEGRVLLKLSNLVIELPEGGLLALAASIPHDLEAVVPSVVLLTLAGPPSEVLH